MSNPNLHPRTSFPVDATPVAASSYVLKRDLSMVCEVQGISKAIGLAEEYLAAIPEDELTTYSVFDEGGKLKFSVTNRRIEGTFVKQRWGGRKGDDAILVDYEWFDATDAILMLDHATLQALDDCGDTTDELGRSHVDWDGPFEVMVVDAVCEYFGVEELEDITLEALAYAKAKAKPQPPELKTITLSIKVQVEVRAGNDLTGFVENLDYTVKSTTPGVRVTDTEIIEVA
ncbi:uncharacterized protein NMK_2189 [Novimethylophilus kurashikiensis]|uniref:Uncharacterized protein n=1 Tax=Novimethylophilus kurashikiensis TaxID=1825523 RepID=A0A2R5F8L9_9PROT|nr:hypothetical protein [Novimethylophilus kurashikiensis]GBG14590.1 uncharacterized protein NMK_2189 [Novimethylophilus kurashikiensis]